MGVKKLLPFLRPLTQQEHLSSFKNTTAGIDIFIFINKACYRFEEEMRETGNFEAFLPYIHHFLDLLEYYQITPICVFDGRSTPKKRKTIAHRHEEKLKNLQTGLKLITLNADDIQLLNREQELMTQEQNLMEQINKHEDFILEDLQDYPNQILQEIKNQDQNLPQSLVIQDSADQSTNKIKVIDQASQLQKQAAPSDNRQNINLNYQKMVEAMSKIQEQKQRVEKGVQQLQKRVETGKKHLKRAIFMKEELISATMNALKSRNVQIIVAPFEGESQLSKLYSLKKIDFAISEDSDLVIHQVPTLFKINIQNGVCDLIDLKNLSTKIYDSPELNVFLRMSKYKKAQVAVLLGTDYLTNVKGIGIKAAINLVNKSRDLQEAVRKIKINPVLSRQLPQFYSQALKQAFFVLLLGTCYNVDRKSLQFCDLKAIDAMEQNKYTEQQIYKIVGPTYAYDQQVKTGMKSARTLLPRKIAPLVREVEKNLNLQALTEKEKQLNQLKKQKQKEQKKKGRQTDIRSFFKPRQLTQTLHVSSMEQCKLPNSNESKSQPQHLN